MSYIVQIFSFGITAFVLGMLIIPYFVDFLWKYKLGKSIRTEALVGKATEFHKLHAHKQGTPTMGGAVILFITFLMVGISIILQGFGFINNSLLWNQNGGWNGETILSLFTLFTIGSLGLLDDYLNIKGIGRTKGISAKAKSIGLFIFALVGALWFYYKLEFKDVPLDLIFWEIPLGIWFIPLFILVIIGASNSANITDGLDGLAGGLFLFAYSVYAYITIDQGKYLFSTLCVVIIGSLLAFLWFNVKPAKFYMGDVGALALGANLGVMAILTNTLVTLFMVGLIFILETLSVIIQITSKKLRHGKKVFIIAPFHHHLEAIGWSEENVVFRFWLIGFVFSTFGIIFYILQK